MEKVFKVADIRKFEQQVTKGDISYSRMVELMNEMAHTHYVVNKNCNKHDVSGSSSRHPKCRGYRTQDIGWGSEYECGYETTIDCDECKYGGGRKDPEAKCNQNYR